MQEDIFDRVLVPPADLFSPDVRTHLKRQRLWEVCDAHQHWVFAVSPRCRDIGRYLWALHEDRVGLPPESFLVHLPEVPEGVLLLFFPRQRLSVEEVLAVMHTAPAVSPDAVEAVSFICVQEEPAGRLTERVTRWVNCPGILN